jgi:hypothetical protein
MHDAAQALVDAINIDPVAVNVAVNLAFVALVGLAGFRMGTTIVNFLQAKMFGQVRLYDVVELRDQKQYKLTHIKLRGVVLEGDRRFKVIPIATWVTTEKTIVEQEVKVGSAGK